MSILTEKQLAAQLSSWKRRLEPKESPAFYGVRTDLAYAGPECISVDQESYRVQTCQSDLEARQVLAAEDGPDHRVVLLFRLSHEHLGADLVARLAARRLLPIDPRSTLRELFGVKTVDPRISQHQELVEALVEKAVVGPVPVATAGVLDTDLAWSTLLGRPEFALERPDLARLLAMSQDPVAWAPVAGLSRALQKLFFAWLEERSGPALALVGAAIAEQGTPAELLLPIGLCLGCLFGEDNDSRESLRTQARTRLEPYLAGRTVDPCAAQAWYLASRAVVDHAAPAQVRTLAGQVDDLLRALKAEDLALTNPFSRRGLEARLSSLSDAVLSYLRRKTAHAWSDLPGALSAIEHHALARIEDYRPRVSQARMLVRLAIWCKEEPGMAPDTSLVGMAHRYLADSSYADRALAETAGIGEGGSLGKAGAKVRQLALAKRVEEQRAFARAFAAWCRGDTREEVAGVEHLLEFWLGPLAKMGPTLLLVLDGMGCPVFTELMEDLGRRGWRAWQSRSHPPVVLATVPSVTALSRKALFSGKIDAADSRTEAVAFRENALLAAVSPKAKPRLFLKGDLRAPDSTGLAQDLMEALADPAQQVLAILLNVVDDQLGGSDQLRIRWQVDSIHHFAEILDTAAEAGRTIVLTSDHGHILELNQSRRLGEDSVGTDRYRWDGPLFDPDHEVALSGKRIEQATARTTILAAATELVRYASKKAGYHGGCSDREVVVPVAVLQREQASEPPSGWDYLDLAEPAWWRMAAGESMAEAVLHEPKPRTRRPPEAREPTRNLELDLEVEVEGSDEAWIHRLLLSPVFREQWASLGRTVPQEAEVGKFLRILHRSGGAMGGVALARQMARSPMRLCGLLAQLKRLLNLDGYAILSEEPETGRILLDIPLARKQFDLDR